MLPKTPRCPSLQTVRCQPVVGWLWTVPAQLSLPLASSPGSEPAKMEAEEKQKCRKDVFSVSIWQTKEFIGARPRMITEQTHQRFVWLFKVIILRVARSTTAAKQWIYWLVQSWKYTLNRWVGGQKLARSGERLKSFSSATGSFEFKRRWYGCPFVTL